MANSWQDVRYGLRVLAKSPGFTFTALLSLALGIGATTAVYSVIYGALINPYPYVGADRMIKVLTEDSAGASKSVSLTGWQVQELRKAKSVESVLAQANWELPTTGSDLPEDVRAVFFTANASSHFGVPALLGRGLLPSDAPDGQDPQPAVVLSFSFWQRHFGGNPEVLGKTLGLAHKNYTIVGVLPRRFAWTLADVYLPLKVTNDPSRPFWVSSVKLKAGVGLDVAEAELQPLLEQFAKETPKHFPQTFRVHVEKLIHQHDSNFEHTLYALFGAVAMLLFIGCANVSILLLARGTARQHELAVRAAVGATRSRIFRQLLTESLVLSLGGVAVGIVLAYGTLAMIVKWLPQSSYPHEAAIQINVPILCFSVGLALVTGLAFGLSPALQLSRRDASQITQSSIRMIGGGLRAKRTHTMLIAGQIAVTLLLLTAAGAAMEGFLRLMHTELGYDPRNTMVVGIPLHENAYITWEERAAYLSQLRQKVAAIPGVVSAAISTMATPPANGMDEPVEILGRPSLEEKQVRLNPVSLEYFSLLSIPFTHGRLWDEIETMRGARLAVINETMSRKFWPNGDALGSAIRMPELKEDPYRFAAPGSDQWLQIVGIVADAKNDGLAKPVIPALYVPYTIFLDTYIHILVHTHGSPLSALHAVRTQVYSLNSDQQIEGQTFTLEELITRQEEWQQGHLATILFGGFSLLALGLALVGLYSVLSYSVAQRTREFGVRMALGAQRKDVLRTVFASATVSVGAGVLGGMFLSLLFATTVTKWTEVSSRNPMITIIAALLLVGASTLACLSPACRASRIDPLAALRCD
jgi:predicted permease